MKPLNEEQAYVKASALCSASEMCPFDVERKLVQWGLPSPVVRRLLERLLDAGFLNEERYCRAFVHDKLQFNRWGRNKITYSLLSKRLPREVVNAALAEVDEEEYVRVLDELLSSRYRVLMKSALSDYELARKLYAVAASRGFEGVYVSRWLASHRLDDCLED